MKKILGVTDFPSGHHYLIIVSKTESIYIPGDERSRTNPGHGYPEHTETVHSFVMIACVDEVELKEELERLYKQDRNRTDVVVLNVSGVVKTKATIQVDLLS